MLSFSCFATKNGTNRLPVPKINMITTVAKDFSHADGRTCVVWTETCKSSQSDGEALLNYYLYYDYDVNGIGCMPCFDIIMCSKFQSCLTSQE